MKYETLSLEAFEAAHHRSLRSNNIEFLRELKMRTPTILPLGTSTIANKRTSIVSAFKQRDEFRSRGVLRTSKMMVDGVEQLVVTLYPAENEHVC